MVVGASCVNIANGCGTGLPHAQPDALGRDSILHMLQYGFTDVVFSQFDDVDHQGHSYGFDESVTQYYNAIPVIDGYVGQFITAINNRPTKAQEDWLYVICTDHGGNGASGHSSNSYNERNVFMILSDGDNSGTANDFIPSANIKRDTVATTMPTTTFRTGGALTYSANNAYGFGTTEDFTIEMRVRKAGATQDKVFIGNKNFTSGNNKGWAISGAASNDHSWKFNMGSGTTRFDLDGGRINDNNWHHIAVTVDRDGRKATYQDGELVAVNDNIFTSDITTTFPLSLGSDVTGGFVANIDVAEIRIWKTALTPQELENWQSQTLNNTHPQYSNLVSYYPLTQGTGNTITDNATTPNNLTVTGAMTTSWITETGTNYLQYNPAKVRSDANFSFVGTENMTIETWVKTGNWGANDGTILSNKNWASGANKGWIISTVPNQNYWKFNIGSGAGSTGRIDLNGGLINDNQWHHIAVSVDRSGDIVLYQDGVEVRRRVNMHQTSTGVTNSIPTATNISAAKQLGIGTDGNSAFPFATGLIAESRIFNTVVAAADINTYKGSASTALSTSHPNKANLQYYYRGHEGTGLIINDISHTADYRNSGTAKNATIANFQTTNESFWFTNTANLNTYKYLQNAVPNNNDLAPTVFKWLGIPINPSWGLDGKPIAVPNMPNRIEPRNDLNVVAPNSTATFNVLTNDVDPESNTLTLSGIENPTNPNVFSNASFSVQGQKPDGTNAVAGTISAMANGNVQFVANASFAGVVKLKYKVADNNTSPTSAIAQLAIIVIDDVNAYTNITAGAGGTPTNYTNGTVAVTYSVIDPSNIQNGNVIATGIQGQTAIPNTLKSATTAGQKSTIRLAFSKPVYNVKFSVAGIDEYNSKNKDNANGDVLTVRAGGPSLPGGSITANSIAMGDFITGDSVMFLGNNSFMPKANEVPINTYTAINAATNNSGNVDFSLAGPITELEVDLASLPWLTGTSAAHSVYISNVSFAEATSTVASSPVNSIVLTGKALVTTNELKWTIDGQQSVVKFTVERSTNGTTFTPIGEVLHDGTTNAKGNYTFIANQVNNTTNFYYRIKTVEQTATTNSSNVIIIRRKNKTFTAKLSVDSPVSNMIQFSASVIEQGNYTLKIISQSGTVTQQQNIMIDNNLHYLVPITKHLSTGNYILEINNGRRRYSQQFVKL